MPTITRDDLLIPEAEQTAVLSALGNSEQTDPWTPAIAQAIQKVDAYTARYTLTDNHYKRLVRALALWEAWALTGNIPDSKQKLYDAAMKELEDIRDGKFDGTLTLASSTAAGAWGSETKVNLRESASSSISTD
jgi:hypothetical protein